MSVKHNDYDNRPHVPIPGKIIDYERPPLGLRPKHIAREMRRMEVREAINRYLHADRAIPLEWIEEYNELMEEFIEWKKSLNNK